MRLVLLALLALPLLAQPDPDFAHKRAILNVMERQQAAWNAGDIEAFMEGYERSDAIVFVGSEIQRGYDDVLARYYRTYGDREKMGELKFSDFEIRILNETAANATAEVDRTGLEYGF